MLTDDGLATLTAKGVKVQKPPYLLDLIRHRSRILVNAGQHGTLCFGMMAGLPQMGLPPSGTDLLRAPGGGLRGKHGD